METKADVRWMLVSGALFALFAVVFGAFAAHGLKNSLTPYAISLIKTATDYQMYHALALLVVAVLAEFKNFKQTWLKISAMCFVAGILLFSGSLYWLAFSGLKWIGMITPIGGFCFIAGWITVIVSVLYKRR